MFAALAFLGFPRSLRHAAVLATFVVLSRGVFAFSRLHSRFAGFPERSKHISDLDDRFLTKSSFVDVSWV